MTPLEAQAYLDSFINHENNLECCDRTTFKLEGVKRLLNLLGAPHRKIPFIHVAGTKGKGSTSAFIAFILKEAGYKVGLYTSPHLHEYQERIRILTSSDETADSRNPFAGKIADQELARMVSEIQPVVEGLRNDSALGYLSFFEVLTALAIYYFKQCQVDCAVLETGLGGRLDATNAVKSSVVVLTPISLEHTQLLGSTIEAIAREKAAIIKNKDQRVVVASQDPEAQRVIKNRCQQYGVKALWLGEDILPARLSQDLRGQSFQVQIPPHPIWKLKTRLAGTHQMTNAALAVGVGESLRHLGFKISPEAIVRGIENTVWPGRFEVIPFRPLVILDGAHNPASTAALVKTVQEILPEMRLTLIFGVSIDKDKKGIARELKKIAQRIIFTRANHPRACDCTLEELRDLFPKQEIMKTQNVPQALKTAFDKIAEDEALLVSGSLFVVGEAREYFIKNQ